MHTALYSSYNTRKKEIRSRLKEFKQVKKREYFYELCFCLLTPQSSGKRCGEAVEKLQKLHFYHNNIDIVPILKEKTRFHHTKAKRLQEMKHQYPSLFRFIINSESAVKKREFLLEHVKGIGLKECSHFLHNIGYRNLAILDRHILKNLQQFGVIDELPKTLTTKKYFEIEKKFQEFSKEVRIPMDELDLLFWAMETGEVFK